MTKNTQHQMHLYINQKKNYNNKFLILLNYNELNSKIDMSQYTILEKFKNCFYLKKND